MKTLNLTITITLLLTTLCVIPANASVNSDVTAAKEFMAEDMYPQAIALLQMRIKDRPADAEAHYQLGLCLSNTGHFSGADNHFASAATLDPVYGDQIGVEYERIGFDVLQNGNTTTSLYFFQKAIKYQPDLMDAIAQEAFSQGEAFFDQNYYKLADSTFSVAINFDSSLKQQASDIFFDLGNSVEDSSCIGYYRTAVKYSGSHNQEIGQRLVQLAKDPMISEADRKKFELEAGRYLSNDEMAEAFQPDYELLDMGGYELLEMGKYKVVNLPDGLPPEKYFRVPTANYSFEVGWNNLNTHFMLKTRSGRIITFEEIKKGKFYLNEKDFMVVPTTNKPLHISIRLSGI